MFKKQSNHRLEYKRNWARNKYKNDPVYRERIKATATKNRDRRFAEHNKLIEGFKKRGCKFCKERAIKCLCAHHLRPASKLFNIGSFVQIKPTLEVLKAELDKCICLCLNCHAKLHEKKRRRERKQSNKKL